MVLKFLMVILAIAVGLIVTSTFALGVLRRLFLKKTKIRVKVKRKDGPEDAVLYSHGPTVVLRGEAPGKGDKQ